MIRVVDCGVIDYGTAWNTQRRYFDGLLAETAERSAEPVVDKHEESGEKARGVLMLCEHPHVYTLGKSGHANNLLVSETFLKSIGASYYHIDRGGDITYHGYGQLVGYPILDLLSLDERGIGLKEYIHRLEESVIETIAEWGVVGRRVEHATGVWLEANATRPERKICAIGVKASHYVTMHGFALNVNTDLNYFHYIHPCGFRDKGVTSIASEVGREVPMGEVKGRVLSHLAAVFGAVCVEGNLCPKDGEPAE